MANEIQTTDAIRSLAPNAEWGLTNETLTWVRMNGDDEPSSDDIAAEVTRLQALYDAKAYQRTRAVAYPEIAEQLDKLYHDMAADKGDKTGTWFAAVKAVKDATAKPE